MNNPITSDYDWSTLYDEYDCTSKRFVQDAPYLYSLSETNE